MKRFICKGNVDIVKSVMQRAVEHRPVTRIDASPLRRELAGFYVLHWVRGNYISIFLAFCSLERPPVRAGFDIPHTKRLCTNIFRKPLHHDTYPPVPD